MALATLTGAPETGSVSAGQALSLRAFLERLERESAVDVVHVTEAVNPDRFEVTAVLQRLEDLDRFPLVVFDRPTALDGQSSGIPLVTNVFASRARCARALGLGPEHEGLELSLEYARREARRLAPAVIPREQAPVKAIVQRGDEVDLKQFPVVRHHRMDGGPYIDMTPVMRDPDSGAYNVAFQRNQVKGPRKLGIHMSPRHNWQIARKYEQAGLPTPVAVVVGHHPAFYIGALNVSPFDADDYEVIGAIANQPLRLTPSETWGDDFLVPADAEIVIEGEIPPGVREVEGPFGEFPGTYGPQRVRWVIDVKAVTRRRDAIYQDTFVGHREVSILGAFPKEGSLYNRIKAVVPGVRGVHLPNSGVGRFHAYISLDKRFEGEPQQAALIALGNVDFLKHVIVVDADDIDVYREDQVLWALATRVQAGRDVQVLCGVKGSALDPSQDEEGAGDKLIVDATRPLRHPFEARIEVPRDAVAAVDLARLIPPDQLARLGLGPLS
ncbi:MAG: UbiD family decarboxylase [Chloroflexi bacterium]|nr:UbiD family decarboxylase [Chloroflexota bacterium]